MYRSKLSTILFCGLIMSSSAFACDLCGAHVCSSAECATEGSFAAGVSEQYSHYSRLQRDGVFVDNVKDQYLSSSISNFFFEGALNDDVTLQLNLPFIDRSYRTIENELAHKGSESGLGDITVLAKYNAIKEKRQDGLLWLQFIAGLELPTGDTDPLAEDHGMDMEAETAHHVHSISTRHAGHDHGGETVEAAVHGHDIALGSGSVDMPVGFVLTYQKAAFNGALDVRYTFRQEGDHDYTYADDLRWSAQAGYECYNQGEQRVNLAMSIFGDHKGRDEMAGETENDTGMNMVGFGPVVQIAMQRSLLLDLGVDIPLNRDNTGIQAVLDYRLRGALSYRF